MFCGVHHPCRCVGASVGQISEAPISLPASAYSRATSTALLLYTRVEREAFRTSRSTSLLSRRGITLHIHAYLTHSAQKTGLPPRLHRTVKSGRLDFLLL